MEGPAVTRARGLPPAFLSDKALVTFAATRDADGERVVLMSWHESAANDPGVVEHTGQMSLTETDIGRLRDFCDAWLRLVPPTEPREAA
jgi:hypothetical protein